MQDAFPSLEVHPLPPYALKHFEFASGDPNDMAYADLAYKFERESAWSLGNVFMSEVSDSGSVSIQHCKVKFSG